MARLDRGQAGEPPQDPAAGPVQIPLPHELQDGFRKGLGCQGEHRRYPAYPPAPAAEGLEHKPLGREHLPPLGKGGFLLGGKGEQEGLAELHGRLAREAGLELLEDHPLVRRVLIHHIERPLGLGEEVELAKTAEVPKPGKRARPRLRPRERFGSGKRGRKRMAGEGLSHRLGKEGGDLLDLEDLHPLFLGIGIDQHALGGELEVQDPKGMLPGGEEFPVGGEHRSVERLRPLHRPPIHREQEPVPARTGELRPGKHSSELVGPVLGLEGKEPVGHQAPPYRPGRRQEITPGVTDAHLAVQLQGETQPGVMQQVAGRPRHRPPPLHRRGLERRPPRR